jgi:hypothetical protein
VGDAGAGDDGVALREVRLLVADGEAARAPDDEVDLVESSWEWTFWDWPGSRQ